MSGNAENYTEEVLSLAKSAGATLAGVADLSTLRDLPVYGGISLKDYGYAISMAVALPEDAVALIHPDNPGILYSHAYLVANTLIDSITLRLAGWISSKGFSSLVIPASMRADPSKEAGHASHKAFACAAGLGWIGRNGLLVTPAHGPRVRLGTVLTDMPLKAGRAMGNQCGKCRACVELCPSGALKYAEFDLRPAAREEIFDPHKCSARLAKNKEALAQKPHQAAYAATVCGMCIKVCPVGKVPSGRTTTT